jgi:hypothetical protein
VILVVLLTFHYDDMENDPHLNEVGVEVPLVQKKHSPFGKTRQKNIDHQAHLPNAHAGAHQLGVKGLHAQRPDLHRLLPKNHQKDNKTKLLKL